jgi:hypothetical protein
MQGVSGTQRGSMTFGVNGDYPAMCQGTAAETTASTKNLTITVQANTATSGAVFLIAIHAVKFFK